MSPRGVPRRAHVTWVAAREYDPPSGANRYICSVGKQSTISRSSASRSMSFPTKWSSCVGVEHRVGSLPSPPRQDVHLDRLLRASQSRSAELRRACNAAIVRSSSIPFSCNDFSSGACYKTLTTDCSERNIPSLRGGSKRTALSKRPNGPVAGLSPENVES